VLNVDIDLSIKNNYATINEIGDRVVVQKNSSNLPKQYYGISKKGEYVVKSGRPFKLFSS